MADNNQGGKKNAPAPPDYMSLATSEAEQQRQNLGQQTQANRPNQSSPFASSTWSQGPNGQWSQQLGFNGPLSGAATSLQQQAAGNLGTPFSLASLGTLGTGDSARQEAISSAYNQAASRLDPAFQQREGALRTRLLNQGLQEGSKAYQQAMGQLGQERNDAYTSALNMAVGQGTAAGDSVFRNNMASRQQAIEELLRQRGQPLADLQGLQGLLQMPSFSQAGQAQAPNLMQAGGMQDAANYRNWQARQGAQADALGAGTQLVGQGLSLLPFFLSDERAKYEVTRHRAEVLPGLPLATFRYHPEAGMGGGLFAGVLAQDVARVAPTAVRRRRDGLFEVHPAFRPVPLED